MIIPLSAFYVLGSDAVYKVHRFTQMRSKAKIVLLHQISEARNVDEGNVRHRVERSAHCSALLFAQSVVHSLISLIYNLFFSLITENWNNSVL